MKRSLTEILLTVSLTFAVLTANAAVYSYRGKLLDGEGKPLKDVKVLVAKIYQSETGGTALWGRQIAVSLDEQGQFSTELSEAVGSALPKGPKALIGDVITANATRSLYLEITVKGDPDTVLPRTRIGSVPTAVCADSVLAAPQALNVAGKFEACKGVNCTGPTTVKGDAIAHGDINVRGAVTIGNSLAVASGGVCQFGKGDLKVADGAEVGSAQLAGWFESAGCVDTMRIEVSSDDFTVNGVNAYISPGTIVIWTSSEPVPNGWVECNGQTYVGSDGKQYATPDLTGRFIIGAEADATDTDKTKHKVGAFGGMRRVPLTADQLGAHTHQLKFYYSGIWSRSTKYTYKDGLSLKTTKYEPATKDGNHQKIKWTSDPQAGHGGKNPTHNNLPPYQAVRYIMKRH